MICKYCGSENVKIFKKINKKQEITIIKCSICSDCFFRIRNKVPHFFTRDFLYNEHIILDKSIWKIADEYNVKIDNIRNCFNRFNIIEIKRCKYCETKENLLERPFNNQFNKPKITAQCICKKCWYEATSISQKNMRENETENKKLQRSLNLKKNYEQNPERISKLKIKLINVWENKTNEEMKIIIKTIKEGYKKRSKEDKEKQKEKRIKTLIKNDSYVGNYCGMGNKAQNFFSILHEFLIYLNINFKKIHYGKFNKNEKAIYVKDISIDKRARFLDFYIKINNKEYAIEFDEKHHKSNINKIKNDLIREWEILQKRPELKIIRINEKQYSQNPYKVILDIIFILQEKENYDYPSLIDQIKNSFL